MDVTADPITLFDAAVNALNAEDWTSMAALCDPVSLAAFRRQLLEQFAPAEPPPEVTAELIMRHSPEMPREVAEYYASQRHKRADPAWRLQEELPGVATVEEAMALTPAELFARWLEGRSPRRQVERLAAEGHIPRDAMETLAAEPIPLRTYLALGAVSDGDRIVHVVYRDEFRTDDVESGDAAQWIARRPPDEQELARETWGRAHVQTASCRRQADGTWRLLAGHDFLQVANTFVSGLVVADDDGDSERHDPLTPRS